MTSSKKYGVSSSEKRLWCFLKAKRLGGHKFRRQHSIHPFIVDFICLKRKLIIELDGGQHATQHQYDERRTLFLQAKGYKVLRFWNNVVLKETRAVLNTILTALNQQNGKTSSPQPSPPAKNAGGEGDISKF